MPRRSDEERAQIEAQAVAQSKLREAVMQYLAAHGVPQDLAFAIAAGREDIAERFVHTMSETFNYFDDLIDEIAELEAGESE